MDNRGRGASQNRYYAIVALNLAIVAAISAAIFVHESDMSGQWETISAYHMASVHSAREAEHELTLLRGDILATEAMAGTPDPGPAEALARTVGNRIYALANTRGTLAELQREFALPQFAKLAAQTDSAFAALFDIAQARENITPDRGLLDAIGLLSLHLQQLERLNLNSAERAAAPEHSLLLVIVALAGLAGFANISIVRRLQFLSAQQAAAVTHVKEAGAGLDAFFTGAPAGMAVIDKDLNCIKWNDTLARMGGREAPGFETGCRIADALPAEHARALMQTFRHTFETGKPFLNVEISDTPGRAGGPARHWISSHFPIPGKNGKTNSVGLIIADVTALKDAEAELRTERNLNNAVLDAANALVIVLDREGRIMRFNRACESMTGYSAGQMIGTRVWDKLLREEEIEPVRQVFESLRADKLSGEFENVRLTGDDGERLISWNNSVMLDDAGEVEFIVSVGLDITEQRAVGDALKTTAENLENAQRMAKIGSWEWDIVSNLEDWSDQVFRVYGLEPGAFQPDGYSYLDYVHPDDRDAMLAAQEKARAEGTPLNIEYRSIGADGVARYIQDQGEIELDADGNAVRMAGTVQDITERKQAEQKLEDAVASLSHAQQLAKIGSWVWDMESGAVSGSDKMYRIYDLHPDGPPLTLDLFLERTHPDDHARYEAVVSDAAREGRPYTISYRVVHPDGRVLIVEEQGEIMEMRPDALPLLRGTVQDVTERRTMEQALRESEARLSAFFDEAPVGMVIYNSDGRYAKINEPLACLTGMWAGEQVGKKPSEVLASPALGKRIEEVNRKVFESGQSVSDFEYSVQPPDGSGPLYFSSTRFPITGSSGETVGIASVAIDITERKRAEQALRESEELFRATFDQAAVGIAQVRPNGRIAKSNRKFADILGYSEDELQVLRFHDITHPDDLEADVRDHARLLAGEIPFYTMEKRYVRGDATIVWANLTVSLVRHKDGAPKYLVAIVEDIAERKRAEEQLRETAENLEHAQHVAHMGSWDWDIVEDKEWWSDEAYRIAGLEVGSVVLGGFESLEYVHPDDRERVQEAHSRSVRDGIPYDIEYRFIRPDGREIILAEYGGVEYDADGKPLRMRGTAQDVTETRRVEAAIRESNRYLDLLFKHSLTSFVLMDREFNFIRVNDAYANVDEKHPEFFPGKNHFDIYPSEAKALFEEVRDSGKPYQALAMPFEYAEHPERGTTFWDWTLVPVADEDGATELMVFSLNNVTERVHAEQALRDSEARLDAFFNKAPVSLGIVDSDYRYVKLNETLALMNGATAEAHVGNRPQDVMAPERAARVEDLLRRTLEHGESIDGEESIVPGPDEAPRYRVYTQFPLSGDPQRPDTLGVVILDVTERWHVEQALQESEARLDAFFTEAPVGLGIIDSERRYLKLNETMARSNGLAVADHVGKTPSELFPREMAEMVESVMDRTLIGGEQIVNEEASATMPDGTMRYWAYSQYPLPGDDKSRGALGVAAVDITELKNAQAELAGLNAELEVRVEERTAELRDAQAELVKNERLATLGQLTATVSHELRNPLGAMRTSMYIVEKKTEGQAESVTRAIERVNRSITRCDQIIDELLDYTRIRSLDIRALPIDDWLAGLLDEQAVPDGVEIRRKFGAPSVRAPADADRLRRAVINVYENACHALVNPHHDAVPRDRNLLTVETRVRKDRFEIVITDNGPGIPTEILQKVFEPLFSTKNFGVGLGLPTVWQIMEQHGGGVTAGKNRGGGTKFLLWLPMVPAMEMTEA